MSVSSSGALPPLVPNPDLSAAPAPADATLQQQVNDQYTLHAIQRTLQRTWPSAQVSLDEASVPPVNPALPAVLSSPSHTLLSGAHPYSHRYPLTPSQSKLASHIQSPRQMALTVKKKKSSTASGLSGGRGAAGAQTGAGSLQRQIRDAQYVERYFLGEPIRLPATFGELKNTLSASSKSARAAPSASLFDSDAALLQNNPGLYSTDVHALRRTIELQKLEGLKHALYATPEDTDFQPLNSDDAVNKKTAALLSADTDGKVLLARAKPAEELDINDAIVFEAEAAAKAESVLEKQRAELAEEEKEVQLALQTGRIIRSKRITVDNANQIFAQMDSRDSAANHSRLQTADPSQQQHRFSTPSSSHATAHHHHAASAGASSSSSSIRPLTTASGSSADFLTNQFSSPYRQALKHAENAATLHPEIRPYTSDGIVFSNQGVQMHYASPANGHTLPPTPGTAGQQHRSHGSANEEKEFSSAHSSSGQQLHHHHHSHHQSQHSHQHPHPHHSQSHSSSAHGPVASLSDPLNPHMQQFLAENSIMLAQLSPPAITPMPAYSETAMQQIWTSYQHSQFEAHEHKKQLLTMQQELIWYKREWDSALQAHSGCGQSKQDAENNIRTLNEQLRRARGVEERLTKDLQDANRDQQAAHATLSNHLQTSASEIAGLRAKMSDMLQRQLHWEKESETLHSQYHALQQELTSKNTHALEQANEILNLKAQIEQMRNKNTAESAMFAREKEEYLKLGARWKNDRTGFQTDIEKQSKTIEELRTKLSRAERENDSMREDKRQHEKLFLDKATEVTRLLGELEASSKEAQALKVRMYTLELNETKAKESLEQIVSKSADSSARIETLQNQLLASQADSQRMREDSHNKELESKRIRGELEARCADLQQQAAAVQLQWKEQHQLHALEIDLLKKELVAQESLIADHKNSSAGLLSELSELRAQHDFRLRQAQHLQSEVAALNNSGIELREQVSTYSSTLKELRTKYKALKVQYMALETLKTQTETNETARLQLERELATQTTSLKSAAQDRRVLEEEIEVLKLELKLHRDQKSEVAFLQARNKELKERLGEIDQLKGEKRTVEMELATMKELHGSHCKELDSSVLAELAEYKSLKAQFTLLKIEADRLKASAAVQAVSEKKRIPHATQSLDFGNSLHHSPR